MIEAFFHLKRDSEKIRAASQNLFSDVGHFLSIDCPDFEFIQCVYANEVVGLPQNVILLDILDRESEPRPFFKEFISRVPPQNKVDAQFLIDFYLQYFRTPPKVSEMGTLRPWVAIDRLEFKPNPRVDDVLGESRGVLMWHYQLENLLRFALPDIKDVKQFRKLLGVQNRAAWGNIEKVRIEEEWLKNIIYDRAVFYWTKPFQIEPAQRLCADWKLC